MKQIFLILVFLFQISLIKSANNEEIYSSSRYDRIDFDEIIKSDRLMKNYANCILDKGACTNEANDLKTILPEALETDCEKCSESQRTGILKVIKYLVIKQIELWNELIAKYDPKGEYREKYKREWQKEGIPIQ